MSILEIFYNQIIPEAAIGKVECYFTYNIIFNVNIENKEVSHVRNSEELFIPTLIIRDKAKFDKLLIEYVNTAYSFYREKDYKNNEELNDFIKTIETLLWSDATSNDFLNAENYLKKRIDFLKQDILTDKVELQNFNISLGNLEYKIKKEKINNEAPYYIEIKINDNEMPAVRFAIEDGKGYIYAIQNNKNIERDKKLNRQLYKVNDGIIKTEENNNYEHPENIVGITPSTLVSATIAISLLKKYGINEILVPGILPVRWNAKEIGNQRRAIYMNQKGIDKEKIDSFLKEEYDEHEKIQMNLTDKFIRTFRRLEYHFNNVNVVSYPFENDEYLHIKIDDELSCNNPLLEEIYLAVHNNVKEK